MTDTPRLAPIPVEGRDPRTDHLLASLRFDPDGPDLNLFTTLAHHPRLLKRWSAFGGLLLAGGALPGRDREVLILRTAANCGADYEWGHHVGIGRAVGLTDAEIEALVLLKTQEKRYNESVTADGLTVVRAVRWLADLGGFTATGASKKPPGAIVVRRGLERVLETVELLQFLRASGKMR